MALSPTTLEELRKAGTAPNYWTGRDMALDHNHCFLCGIELTAVTRTDEHVFPRWMQNDFELWDQRLTLLNLTGVRYRQLTIPCCKECNEFWLGRVEQEVSLAFRTGTTAVENLDRTLLCLWMAKIYYGLRFKELALPMDRKEPSGRAIVEREQMARHSELHHILQATRERVRFNRIPGSVHVFRAQVPAAPQLRFDYRDLRFAPFLALRVGPTVVVASLLDWEAIGRIEDPYFDVADQLELHPWQFHEVAAHAAYRALRFNLRFGYITIPKTDHDVLEPMIIDGSDDEQEHQPLRPFVPEEFARVLAEFTGLPLEDLYMSKTEEIWSNLMTADGRALTVDLNQVPADALLVPPSWDAKHRDDDHVIKMGDLR